MKTLNKVLAIFLSSLSFASVLTACKKGEDPVDSPSSENNQVEVVEGEYLLKNAQSEYKIVIPENPLQYERTASEEFNYFFEKATGITLPIVYETGLTYDDNSRYISLGENTVQEQAGVSCNVEEMNRDGFIIKTVEKSVFIMGGCDLALVYGIYALLNDTVNYECYGMDNYYYETNVANIPLKKYNVVDVPDIRERKARHGTTATNPTLMLRMGFLTRDIGLDVANTSHSSMFYLPKTKYFNNVCTVAHAEGEECYNDVTDITKTMDDFPNCDNPNYHPKWYMSSANPTQLCYTAHGDSEEYELMQEACLDYLKPILKRDLVSQYAHFSLTDDSNWCTCDACKDAISKYHAPSGAVIVFLNNLVEKVYDWFETEEGKPYARDFYFVTFAYMTLEGAPVVQDANGNYSPAAPEVVCHPKVIPYLALTVANYTQPLSTGEKNKTALENIKAWSVIADKIWAWTYVANFRLYLVPLDTFGATQDWYQTYTKYANVVFYQAQGKSSDSSISTGFIGLQTYLDAKLAWDVNADVNQLIKDYFKATYRDASDILYTIFEEYRVLSKYNETTDGQWLTNYIGGGKEILSEKFWPKNQLEKWRADFDKALAAVEGMKERDPELYQTTLKFVRSERVWVNYVYYSLYKTSMPSPLLSEVKSTLLSDLEFCGINEECENSSLSSLKTELAS